MAAPRPPRCLLALLLTAAAPSPPPNEPARLEPALQEERRLAALRVAAASRLRAAETEAATLAEQLVELTRRKQESDQRLAEQAEALGPFLPLAERLALYPAETLLAVPAPPEQAIRGLAILHGITRHLERDAAALRAEQAHLAALQGEVQATLGELRKAQAQQALHAAQLDRQIEATRALRPHIDDPAADAARRAAAEAARADSLRGALAAVQTSRPPRASPAGLARAAVLPVAGPIIRRWGDQTEAGPSTGVAYRAPPASRVLAPCASRVAFAGPFRSYGKLVILDCGAGYHFVLAGLDRLDVQPGQALEPGEPLGVMPAWNPAAAGPHPALYLELRRDGQPVNPSPFFAGRN